jgi:hypothetical protein
MALSKDDKNPNQQKPEAAELLQDDALDQASGGLKKTADPDDGGEYARSATIKKP